MFRVSGSFSGSEVCVAKNSESWIEDNPGSFRACSRCGWVRYVPFNSRQLCCRFPGKDRWRCGLHPTQAGWALSEEIPVDAVAARNEAVSQAFRALKEEREAPVDERSRLQFLSALRDRTRSGGEEARRGRRKAAVGLRPVCKTPGCKSRSAPRGLKCTKCRYLAKKEGEKRLQEAAHGRRQQFLWRQFAKRVSEKAKQEEAKEAMASSQAGGS